MPAEARRSERVDYRAPVELVAHADPPCQVLARSLDLGAGGMQLSAPIQMQVGAHVVCRVTLDGTPTALPGRVAWLRAHDPARHGDGHGMGICFDPLGNRESALVHDVIDRAVAAPRTVQLDIAGLEHSIEAEGLLHAHGIRLSAALPVIERGRELSFRLAADGPSFSGRIGQARLIEIHGERRLEVDVLVEDWEAARARSGAPASALAKSAVAEASSVAVTAREPERPAVSTARADRRPTQYSQRTKQSRFVRGTTLATTALLVGAAVFLTLRAGKPAHTNEFVAHPKPKTELLRPAEPTPPAVAIKEPLPIGAAEPASVSLTSEAPNKVIEHASSKPNQASGANDANEVDRSHVASVPSSPSVAPNAQAAATSIEEPIVLMGETETSLQLPFSGSLEGMRVRIWSAPHALAVDLPHGRTSLPLGRHMVSRGAVADVQLNARRDELLLRMKVTAPIGDYHVAIIREGTLEIRIAFEHARTAAAVGNQALQ